MRKINIVQIVVLILCLGVTGAIITMRPISHPIYKSIALETELLQLRDRYEMTKNRLSPRIVEELKLDDFVFQTYSKDGESASLYVGYYFSGKKVGAAHDPQVCYPGQGWKLSHKVTGGYGLDSGKKIKYSSIIAELEGKKELIFYWFQIDDKTADNTFFQKLILFQKKIMRQGESNAFVRISTSLNDKSQQEAQKYLLKFIDDFYPLFLGYVNNDLNSSQQ